MAASVARTFSANLEKSSLAIVTTTHLSPSSMKQSIAAYSPVLSSMGVATTVTSGVMEGSVAIFAVMYCFSASSSFFRNVHFF